MRQILALLAAASLVAACANKKDDTSVLPDTEAPATSAAPAATEPGTADSAAPGDSAGPGDTAAVTEPPTTVPAAAPERGGRLVVGGESEVSNPWTPAAMQCDSFCLMRARTFFDPLAVIGDDGQVHGYLAETIEPNDDATVWTVTLRPGITFTDGTPVDAVNVVESLKMSGDGILISAALKDIARVDGELDIRVVDDLTFEVHTGKNGDPAQPLPWPTFPYGFVGQWGLIASPTWLTAVAEGSASPSEPVGSGPFVVTSYTPGDSMTVERNPDYWLDGADGQPLPYLDEIVFRVMPDPEVRQTALEAGDLDIVSTADAASIAEAQDSGDVVTELQTDQGDTTYLMIDLAKTGWEQDRDVRCALAQALDRDEVNQIVSGGVAEVANGPFSPGQEGHLDDTGFPGYDPDAAAAAIADWEAANGPLTISVQTLPIVSSQTLVEFVRSSWVEAGADVNVVPLEQSKLINNVLFGAPEYEVTVWRNHAGMVLDQQYWKWHSSSAAPDGSLSLNFARLADPTIDQLLDEARQSADPEQRRQNAEAVNRRMAEQCFMIPTTWTMWAIVHQPEVTGFGTLALPDGTTVPDGLGSPGTAWLAAVGNAA